MPLLAADRALADAYAHSPAETKDFALHALRGGTDRGVTTGVTRWLGTLGPAAEWGLADLDALAQAQRDNVTRDQAVAASKYIRRALQVAPDPGEGPADAGLSARHEMKGLLREVAAGGDPVVALPKLINLIEHPDPYVRAGATEGLAILMPPSAVIPRLVLMLQDDAVAEVGIPEEYECKGRLFHWRVERWSARAAAIRALFATGTVPPGALMLEAMLAEASQAHIECGETALPTVFRLDEWKQAAEAAGGLAEGLPKVRATWQRCQGSPWQGTSSPYVCAAALADVIRQLDGRLIS